MSEYMLPIGKDYVKAAERWNKDSTGEARMILGMTPHFVLTGKKVACAGMWVLAE